MSVRGTFRLRQNHSGYLAIVASVWLAGCLAAGEDPAPVNPAPPTPKPKPDPDPDPTPVVIDVPISIATLATTATCAALGAGERVVAVSPEGHLWLATSSTVTRTTTVRVRDGWDVSFERTHEIGVAEIDALQAWSATVASMIADGELYRIDDGSRTLISTPTTLAADATLCGDPTKRAFVYSDGTLLQRVDDEWLEWTGLEAALDTNTKILSRDGECLGADDAVWLQTKNVEMWQLGPSSATRPGLLEGGTHPVLRDDDILTLKDGHLFIGPEPWVEHTFAHGNATMMSAAGSYVWVVAGDELLRYDGTDFVRVDQSGAIDGLFPHASGGVWITRSDSVCHVAARPMLRVKGLRNGEQRLESAFNLRVRATDDALAIGLSIDGTPVVSTGVEDGWFTFSGDLEIGWHELELSTPDAPAKRTLAVKHIPAIVRTFAADIQPIYAAHCASCHAVGVNPGAPEFGSYEDWTMRAAKIRDRVVVREDMPPTSARTADWGEEQVTVINEWLSGGLKP